MSSPFEPSLLYEKRDFFTHGFIGIDQITTKVHHRVQVKKKSLCIFDFIFITRSFWLGKILNLIYFLERMDFKSQIRHLFLVQTINGTAWKNKVLGVHETRKPIPKVKEMQRCTLHVWFSAGNLDISQASHLRQASRAHIFEVAFKKIFHFLHFSTENWA